MVPYRDAVENYRKCRCYFAGSLTCVAGHSKEGTQRRWAARSAGTGVSCTTSSSWATRPPSCEYKDKYSHKYSCGFLWLKNCYRDELTDSMKLTASTEIDAECCLDNVDDCASRPCQQVCRDLQGKWSGGNSKVNYTCSCHAGHVINPDLHTCTDCRCEPGLERAACVLPLTSCTGCTEGKYKDWLGVGPCSRCESCPAGKHLVGCAREQGGLCEDCPAGQFKPDEGLWNSACVDCQPCTGTGDSMPARVGCGASARGICVSLVVQKPACTSMGCTPWWAGGPEEVVLAASAPLCVSSDGCGHIKVEMLLGARFVGLLGMVHVTPGISQWTLAFKLPAETPGGYSYSVRATYFSGNGPLFDGRAVSDEFPVRDNVDRLMDHRQRASWRAIRGEHDIAEQLLSSACSEARGGNDAVTRCMRPKLQADVKAVAEAACTDLERLKDQDSNRHRNLAVPRLSLSALIFTTSSLLDTLKAFKEKERNNRILNLMGGLRDLLEKGQHMTQDQIRQMGENLRRESSSLSLEEPLRLQTSQLEHIEREIQRLVSDMYGKRGELRVLSVQTQEELKSAGFDLRRWIDVTAVDVNQTHAELQQLIKEYNDQQRRAAKAKGIFNYVGGALKVVAGVALMFTGNAAGYYLVADGAVGIATAEEDAMRLPLGDLRQLNSTLNHSINWISQHLLPVKDSFLLHDEKELQTAQTTADIINTVIPIVRALPGVIPETDPELPSLIAESKRMLEELQQLQIILEGVLGSVRGVNQAWQGARDTADNVFRGLDVHAHVLQIEIQSRTEVTSYFIDRLMGNQQATTQQNLRARVHAKRAEGLMLAQIELYDEYHTLALELLSLIEESKVRSISIARLQAKVEEARKAILESTSEEPALWVNLQQLSDLQDDSFSSILPLQMSIMEMLRQQKLALEYKYLMKVQHSSVNDDSNVGYESLKQVQNQILFARDVGIEDQGAIGLSRIPQTFSVVGDGLVSDLSALTSSRSFQLYLEPQENNALFDERVVGVEVYLIGVRSNPAKVDIGITFFPPAKILDKDGQSHTFFPPSTDLHFEYLPSSCMPHGQPIPEEMVTSGLPKYALWLIKVYGDFSLEGLREVRLHLKVRGRRRSSANIDYMRGPVNLEVFPGQGCNEPQYPHSSTTNLSESNSMGHSGTDTAVGESMSAWNRSLSADTAVDESMSTRNWSLSAADVNLLV